MSRRRIIVLVAAAGLAVAGCGGGSPDTAAPSSASGPAERSPSPVPGEPTVALAGPDDTCLDAAACEDAAAAAPGGTAPEERGEAPDTGVSAGPPNGRPVPKVVGAPLEAACRTLRRSQYHGRVFSAEGAGVPGPGGTRVVARRVVEQLPEPGSRGAAIDAPVYLGVPGPLPGKLPTGTSCPWRVFRNLPANFPTVTDE